MPRTNTEYAHLVAALQDMPEHLSKALQEETKRQAELFREMYQDSLKNNNLGLPRLSVNTVKAKLRAGNQYPTSPLVAKGESKKNSYINNLSIKPLKKYKTVVGIKINIRKAKHHKSNKTLEQLWDIHEGAGERAKIPHRPVLQKTWDKFNSTEFKTSEIVKEAQKAVNELIGRFSRYKG